MRKFILILAIFIVGCDENKLKPAPKIEVEIQDNTDETRVVVYYRHHRYSQNSDTCEHLNTLGEIQHYKQQVEFLLKRLDEAETKFKVHEPEDETK